MIRVVAAVISKNGRVLLAERATGPRAGTWEFPGGKVERGELPRSALRRELEEELGVVVEVGAEMARVVHHYPDMTIDLSLMQVTIITGVPEPNEHHRLQWLNLSAINRDSLSGADARVVDQIIGTLQGLRARER